MARRSPSDGPSFREKLDRFRAALIRGASAKTEAEQTQIQKKLRQIEAAEKIDRWSSAETLKPPK